MSLLEQRGFRPDNIQRSLLASNILWIYNYVTAGYRQGTWEVVGTMTKTLYAWLPKKAMKSMELSCAPSSWVRHNNPYGSLPTGVILWFYDSQRAVGIYCVWYFFFLRGGILGGIFIPLLRLQRHSVIWNGSMETFSFYASQINIDFVISDSVICKPYWCCHLRKSCTATTSSVLLLISHSCQFLFAIFLHALFWSSWSDPPMSPPWIKSG